MNRIITSLLLTFAILGLHAEQTYKLKVGEFSQLTVIAPLNVDYICSPDSAGMAVFTCDPSVASALMFNVNGSKLTVRTMADENTPSPDRLPRIKVYSRFLTRAENQGDSTLRVLSVAGTPKFEGIVEGNGTLVVRDIHATDLKLTDRLGHGMIVASGKCDNLKASLTGTGVIQADDVEANVVSVNAKGTGSVGVWAVEKLSVTGLGSTSVYYKGNPEIKTRSLGIKPTPIQ